MLNEEQHWKDGQLVCTCCNTIVMEDMKTMVIGRHIVHANCGEKFLLVEAVRTDMQPIIARLPEDFFSGTAVLRILNKAYTVSQFKLALFTLCEYIAKEEHWLGKQFHHIADLLKNAIERSEIRDLLMPAILPVMKA